MAFPRPKISSEQALNLASKLYSLNPSNTWVVAELESYEDRNFLLKVKQGQAENQDSCEKKFVLKIINTVTSSNTQALTVISKVLLFLNEKGVQCRLPQPSIYGKNITWCRFPKRRQDEASKWSGNEDFQVLDSTEPPPFEGKHYLRPNAELVVNEPNSRHISDDNYEVYAVQLLSFLPGKLLGDVKFDDDVMHKFGLEVGKLHKVLKEFSQTSDFHDSHFKPPNSDWLLQNSPTLIMKYCHVIEDDSRRALIQEIAQHFQRELVPKLKHLETQFIHGDLNEHNVIVEQSSDGRVEFKGFIDYGNCDVSCRALDMAVAVAYIMIEASAQHGINAIDAAGVMLRGYQLVFSLSLLEMEIVLEGAKTRICHSLVFGAYSYKYLTPDNDYLLHTAIGGWKALDKLVQTPTKDIYDSWFSS